MREEQAEREAGRAKIAGGNDFILEVEQGGKSSEKRRTRSGGNEREPARRMRLGCECLGLYYIAKPIKNEFINYFVSLAASVPKKQDQEQAGAGAEAATEFRSS